MAKPTAPLSPFLKKSRWSRAIQVLPLFTLWSTNAPLALGKEWIWFAGEGFLAHNGREPGRMPPYLPGASH